MATISSLLRDRVTLQVNSVDRIFLAGYMPKLQSEGQVVRFLLDRGFPIPSPAALGRIGDGYRARGRAVRTQASDPGGAFQEGRVQGDGRPAVRAARPSGKSASGW